MKSKLRVCQSIEIISLLLALFLVGGCATCSHIIEDFTQEARSRDSLIYAGTKYHRQEMKLNKSRNRSHWSSQISYSMRWWHYIDLPLCAIADTILLPYTAPRTWYSRWKGQPTKEETAIEPYIKEYALCLGNLDGLDADKVTYIQLKKLGPTDNPPQDIEFYREELKEFNKPPFYECPSGGKYTVGKRDEEPSCSIHGSLSQAKKALYFMCNKKRLPEYLSTAFKNKTATNAPVVFDPVETVQGK